LMYIFHSVFFIYCIENVYSIKFCLSKQFKISFVYSIFINLNFKFVDILIKIRLFLQFNISIEILWFKINILINLTFKVNCDKKKVKIKKN
jgi:hypothetical protein